MLTLIDHVKENINNKKFELVDARRFKKTTGPARAPKPSNWPANNW